MLATTPPLAIPEGLAFPNNAPVRDWTIYRDMLATFERLPVRKENWLPVAADQRNLAARYDPSSSEGSNIGVGRTALALAQVIIDVTAGSGAAWRSAVVEGLVMPGESAPESVVA